MGLTVSVVADRVGLSPDAVRYYERLGLLPPPARSAAGYRLYDEAAVERLRFVKGAQRVGLRLREIGELLEVIDRGQCPCGHTEALLRAHVAEIDAELGRTRPPRCIAGRADPGACPAAGAGLLGGHSRGVVVRADLLSGGR